MDSNLAIALKNFSDTIQEQRRDIIQLQKEIYANNTDINYKKERIIVLEKANADMLRELTELKTKCSAKT